MAWYEDLAPWESARFRSVGWLSRDHPFDTGEVDAGFFGRLCELAQDPWAPAIRMGHHPCEFCRFSGGGYGHFEGHAIPGRSSRELFIPGEGFLYVSPVSIAHYIDAHGYCPPAEFQRAVLQCPPMRSMEYLKRILANGGRGLIAPRRGDDS
jgi:hypothetical protein